MTPKIDNNFSYKTKDSNNLKQPEIEELTDLVQEGLTYCSNNRETAKNDLIEHINGNKIIIIKNKKNGIAGFGVFSDVGKDLFELAFIVCEKHRNKGLGKFLVKQSCLENKNKKHLTASTQNYVAYLAFKNALPKGIKSPNLTGSSFNKLCQNSIEQLKKFKQIKKLDPRLCTKNLQGILPKRYGEKGLYKTNINKNNPFPIDTTTGDGVFLLIENPYYKENV